MRRSFHFTGHRRAQASATDANNATFFRPTADYIYSWMSEIRFRGLSNNWGFQQSQKGLDKPDHRRLKAVHIPGIFLEIPGCNFYRLAKRLLGWA
jgi:hypothetical protein